MIRQRKQNVASGFTIAELLVAVSVFLVIITVVLGGLVSSIARERSSRLKTQLENDIYVLLDGIEREIAQSTRIGCGSLEVDCDDGSLLVIELVDGRVIEYGLSAGNIYKSVDGGAQLVAVSGQAGSVDAWRIWVKGAAVGPGDLTQPVAAVSVAATTAEESDIHAFRYFTQFNFDVSS